MAWNPNSLGTEDESEDNKDNTSSRRSIVPPAIVPHPPSPSERPAQADRPERPPVIMWEASRFAMEQATKNDEDNESDEDDDEDTEAEADVDTTTPATPVEHRAVSPVAEEEPVEPDETTEPSYARPVVPPVPYPASEQTSLTDEERAESEALLRSATTEQTAAAMSGPSLGQETGHDEIPAESDQGSEPPATTHQPEAAVTGNVSVQEDAPEPVSDPGAGPGSPPTPPAGPPPRHNEFGSPAPEPEPTPQTGSEQWQPTPTYYQPSPNAGPGYRSEVVPVRTTEADLSHYEAAARAQGRMEGVIVAGVVGYFLGKKRANRKSGKTIREMKKQAENTEKNHTAILTEHVEAMRDLRRENQTLQRGAPAASEAPLTAHTPNAYNPPRFESAAAVPVAAFRSPEAQMPNQPGPEKSAAQPEPPIQEINPFASKDQEQKPDHYVRSEWLNIGVDKEGHAIDSQQEYGRAFQEEVRQEQAGALQGRQDSGGPSGGGAYTGPATIGGQQAYQALDSGQITSDHTLSGGAGNADLEHRLPEPKKQIVSNIANPWFWLMFAIIVAAFFAAALI